MKSKFQILKNILLFLFLIIITFVVIFSNTDFKQTINIMLNVKSGYIFGGIIVMALYFVLEGFNIKLILKTLGDKVSLLNTISELLDPIGKLMGLDGIILFAFIFSYR